jgi:hypothetical protein
VTQVTPPKPPMNPPITGIRASVLFIHPMLRANHMQPMRTTKVAMKTKMSLLNILSPFQIVEYPYFFDAALLSPISQMSLVPTRSSIFGGCEPGEAYCM